MAQQVCWTNQPKFDLQTASCEHGRQNKSLDMSN